MIEVVFFDFYKTLVFYDSTKANFQKVTDRYGVEVNWERYQIAQENIYTDIWGGNPTYSLQEVLVTAMMQECEFVRTLGIQEHVEQVAWELLQFGHPLYAAVNAKLYDDVVPTLQHLRDAGFQLAIVSNWDAPLDPLIERLGIADYFDTIVASHDVRVKSEKPDSHIFNYALEAVGVSAEEAVHVGDTYEADVIGAKNVGIRPILIDRDSTQIGRWKDTIQNLAELPILLKESPL